MLTAPRRHTSVIANATAAAAQDVEAKTGEEPTGVEVAALALIPETISTYLDYLVASTTVCWRRPLASTARLQRRP